MAGEFRGRSPFSSAPGSVPTYHSTRRTALVLVGEGTSAAYLAGALRALETAGVRVDLILGRGVGAIVAAFGAIQSGGKLLGEKGLLTSLGRRGPWRLRTPYRVAVFCLGAAFAVFLSPALLAVLILLALPFVAAARIVAPDAMASLFGRLQEQIASFSAQLDPIYLRAMAFPVAVLFAILLVGWLAPGLIRRSSRQGALGRFLGEGVVDLSPLSHELERTLWEAVRGASTEARPPLLKDVGLRYRDLLAASLGQPGFSELIFYTLDLDTGQEIPFVLLKDRWRTRLAARGPASGALLAEPVNLAAESGSLLFDALVAAVSPPGLAPPVPLKLPLTGRDAGEVHLFASSLLTGRSTVADAIAAGAEQVIYVSGSSSAHPGESGIAGSLSAAAVRQSLEEDLRWAEESGTTAFIIRPDKSRLKLFEFSGRALPGGDRLGAAALAAHGEQDAFRLFIRPIVGEVSSRPGATEEGGGASRVGMGEETPGHEERWGPQEF
jgi:hypothetical protein